MAYTGTGTQADPYLVSTLADLKECAAISGAYVKVTSDIDAASDGIQGRILIDCTMLYADEMTTVSNINIVSYCVFEKKSAYNVTVRNINFKDLIYAPTENMSDVFYIHNENNGYSLKFINCKFSVQGNRGDKIVSFACLQFNTLIFEQCAIFIDLEHSGFSSNTDTYNIIHHNANGSFRAVECTIRLKGTDGNPNSMVGRNFVGTFRYCTVKISIYFAGESSTQTASVFDSSSNNNILIIDCNANMSYSVGGLAAIDAENSSNGTFSGSGIYRLTEAQIKSEEYLRSINFIP